MFDSIQGLTDTTCLVFVATYDFDNIIILTNQIFNNKTKVIRADLLDLDLDLDFEDIFKFCNISVMATFQFWEYFSFGDISF